MKYLAPLAVAAALIACDEPAHTPETGTHHQPPVTVADVPMDYWFCDMGTVEYSRPDPGSGKCPICGMDLVHKTKPDQATAFPDFLKKKQEADAKADPTRHPGHAPHPPE